MTGLTLWEGIQPDHVRFVSRSVTRNYVVAIHNPNPDREDDSVAYFYDHRHGSGVIPKLGGAPSLGMIQDVVAILAVDNGLLLQAGSTLHAWTHE